MKRLIQTLIHAMKSTGIKFDRHKRSIKKTKAFADFFSEFLVDREKKKIPVGFFIEILKKYSTCIDFMQLDSYSVDKVNYTIEDLIKHSRDSKKISTRLKNIQFEINNIDDELREKVCMLTCFEAKRLDESLNDYLISSFHSSIIMAVVAVESRLHELIQKKNKRIYKQYFEKAPLGQLVDLFSDLGYKDGKFRTIKKILPSEYKPFIDILNQFRVFSAHPKGTDFTRQQCATILTLSFSILMDKRLKLEQKKLIC